MGPQSPLISVRPCLQVRGCRHRPLGPPAQVEPRVGLLPATGALGRTEDLAGGRVRGLQAKGKN